MPEDKRRSGGVNTEADEVKVGGDVVGQDKTTSNSSVQQTTNIDARSKEPASMSVGVVGVVGLILIVVFVLALIFGPQVLKFGQVPGPSSGQTPIPTSGQSAISNTRPASANDIPPVSLVGLNYTVDGWNTRSLDLRTASTSGIGINSNGRLLFSDLWVSIPADAPDYQVYAEFYASDDDNNPIGASEAVPLKQGVAQLGAVQVSNGLQWENRPDTWRVQKNWASIEIILVTTHGNDVVGRNRYSVKFDPGGYAWFHAPPNVTFASIVYAINDGPDQILDFRADNTRGIQSANPFTLTLREVWYNSTDERDNEDMTFYAYLTTGGYNGDTKQSTDPIKIHAGIQQVVPFTPMSWIIPADFIEKPYYLIVYWIRNDGAAMNTLELPIRSSPNAETTPGVSNKVLPIESIASNMHEYLTADAGSTSSSRLAIIYGSNPDVTYEHQYSFPDKAKGFAGLIFGFDKPEDVSAYDFLEYTIAIDGSPTYCSLALGDVNGGFKEVLCQGAFATDSGITAKVDAGKQTITIPLRKNYAGVDLGSIVKLYTVINPGVSKGDIDIKVSDIRFIKQ